MRPTQDKEGQCDIPLLEDGVTDAQRRWNAARTYGRAVACVLNVDGECDIPTLEHSVSYTQVSAGRYHMVILRADGRAAAGGDNHGQNMGKPWEDYEKCHCPPLAEKARENHGKTMGKPWKMELSFTHGKNA